MKPIVSQYGERSEHQDLLASSLHEFQCKLKAVKRNGEGAYGKYSDPNAVCSAITSALPDTGLSYYQFPHDYGEGKIVLETTIMHKSGQFRTGYKTIYVSGMDSAEQGGDLGYWSRICLIKSFGLWSETVEGHTVEGDDGQPGRGAFAYESLTGKGKTQYDQVVAKLTGDTPDEKRQEILGWVDQQVGKGVWSVEMADSIKAMSGGNVNAE
jgi:hypothetical protein